MFDRLNALVRPTCRAREALRENAEERASHLGWLMGEDS